MKRYAQPFIIAILLAFVIYQHNANRQLRSQIIETVDQKDLGKGTVRSSTSIGTQDDINDAAADAGMNMSAVKKDMEEHGTSATGVNVTESRTTGETVTNAGSSRTRRRSDSAATTSVTSCVCPSIHEVPAVDTERTERAARESKPEKSTVCRYDNDEQILDLNEKVGSDTVPFAEVSFKSWTSNPWNYVVYPRSYKSTVLFTEDDDGNKIAYSHSTITVADKTVNLPVETSKFMAAPKPARFRVFPRMYLSSGVGFDLNDGIEWQAGLGLYILNYGPEKLAPTWQFAGLGLNYSTTSSLSLSLVPVSYNIGPHIPFLHSLYLGPSVSVGLDLGFSFGASLSANL